MKILYVNTFYEGVYMGGAEKVVQSLSHRFASQGNKIHILTLGEKDETLKEDDIIIHRMKNRNVYTLTSRAKHPGYLKIIYHIVDMFNPFTFVYIVNFLKTVKPDIINTHNIAGISPSVWIAARICKIPVVHTVHDHYLICPRTTLLNSKDQVCIQCPLPCQLYRKAMNWMSKYVNAITAPSSYIKGIHRENGFINFEDAFVIPNFHKNNNASAIIRTKKHTEIHYGFIGALEKHKGIIKLLNSFLETKNQNIRLKIAGSGSCEEFVKQCSSRDSRIEYVGYVSGGEVEKFYSSIDILVMPSICCEVFPLVFLEAYSHRKPVVANHLGGMRDIILQGGPGELVDISTEVLREKFEKNEFAYLLNKYSEGDYHSFMEKFEFEKVMDKYQSLYALAGNCTEKIIIERIKDNEL